MPDKAVGYSMASTITSALTAPLTVTVIARFLTPEEQGIFYTFGSLLALQFLFEVGLSQCLIQFISHDSAPLTILRSKLVEVDRFAMNFKRLVALYSLSVRWYIVIALLVPILIGPVGYFFINSRVPSGVVWAHGWWSLCFATGIYIVIQPRLFFLEGCRQIESVAKYRLLANVVRLFVLCGSLAADAGLYAPAMATAASAGVMWLCVNINWGSLFAQLGEYRDESIDRITVWRNEVWPLQWRTYVSSISGYFIFNAFTPVILACSGAVEAGKFGMTWSLIQGISNLASAYGVAKISFFAALVSEKKWRELYQLWRRVAFQSTFIAVVCVLVLVSGAVLANSYGFEFANRLASAWTIVALGFGTVVNQVIFAHSYYLRAHKEEPFLMLSVVVAAGIFGVMWLLVPIAGALGAALAYVSITLLIGLPASLHIFRAKVASHLGPVDL